MQPPNLAASSVGDRGIASVDSLRIPWHSYVAGIDLGAVSDFCTWVPGGANCSVADLAPAANIVVGNSFRHPVFDRWGCGTLLHVAPR